jgi:RNA polymerase sigma-70 factor (ECF subfamily)
VDGEHAARVTTAPEQLMKLDARDFRRALAKLGAEQREALILVGPAGFSYDEAAEICGCAVGTIKSRVNRARQRLSWYMDEEPASDAPKGKGGRCKEVVPANG